MMLPARIADRFKALILILLAIFLAEKLVSGTLYYYIGPRFSWLAVVGVVILILLASSFNLLRHGPDGQHNSHDHYHDHEHNHSHGDRRVSVVPLFIATIPLALGVIVPARPLGASAVDTRGVSTGFTSPADTSASILTIAPAERNVLDWVRAMSANPEPTALDGQSADVVGFVYRDARFDDDQFMVGRFTMTCCVADALAIGVVVHSTEASVLEADSWVRVTGTFQAGTLGGSPMPVLEAAEISLVMQPEQPYLFP